MYNQVVIHSSSERKEYFFSTKHCQPNIPEGFVRCTIYFPHCVVARPEFPTGVIASVEDIVRLYYSDSKEIPNPNLLYQP